MGPLSPLCQNLANFYSDLLSSFCLEVEVYGKEAKPREWALEFVGILFFFS